MIRLHPLTIETMTPAEALTVRERLGISAHKMAQDLGVSSQVVTYWEQPSPPGFTVPEEHARYLHGWSVVFEDLVDETLAAAQALLLQYPDTQVRLGRYPAGINPPSLPDPYQGFDVPMHAALVGLSSMMLDRHRIAHTVEFIAPGQEGRFVNT